LLQEGGFSLESRSARRFLFEFGNLLFQRFDLLQLAVQITFVTPNVMLEVYQSFVGICGPLVLFQRLTRRASSKMPDISRVGLGPKGKHPTTRFEVAP
jgi:hypothetical protein